MVGRPIHCGGPPIPWTGYCGVFKRVSGLPGGGAQSGMAFLGYELDEPIPDHSVLRKARRRFGPAVCERCFRRIVQLCEAGGLVEGDVLLIDSTLLKANASMKPHRSRPCSSRS